MCLRRVLKSLQKCPKYPRFFCVTQIDDLLLGISLRKTPVFFLQPRKNQNHAHTSMPGYLFAEEMLFCVAVSLSRMLRYLQPPEYNHNLIVAGDEVRLDGEHLCGDGGGEGIDLASVLFDLTAVDKSLESRGLLGKLEKLLPLILGQQRLLCGGTAGVLGLALRLPLGDLGLLTSERTLVELVVVELGVVGLYAVEEEVASLLEEGID